MAIKHRTDETGVFYRDVGTSDRQYYIQFKRDGKLIEQKVGRESEGMSVDRAAIYRKEMMKGNIALERDKRKAKKALKYKSVITLGRVWRRYLKNRKATGKSLSSALNERNRYKNYLRPRFPLKHPDDITQNDIENLKLEMLKTKSPATVRHVLTLFAAIINFGARHEMCKPLQFKIEKPKVDNQRTEDLTNDQLKSLLNAINESKNIQVAAMLKMVLCTGMRRGELFKLRWTDIDYERNFILLRNPKGGKSEKIPLNTTAREILDNHPKLSKYVFPGKDGKKRTYCARAANRIRDKAGLPKTFRAFHGLRHAFASSLASSGKVDLYTLQKLLTHKSPQMTQRYAHLRDSALRQASDVASDIISDALNK